MLQNIVLCVFSPLTSSNPPEGASLFREERRKPSADTPAPASPLPAGCPHSCLMTGPLPAGRWVPALRPLPSAGARASLLPAPESQPGAPGTTQDGGSWRPHSRCEDGKQTAPSRLQAGHRRPSEVPADRSPSRPHLGQHELCVLPVPTSSVSSSLCGHCLHVLGAQSAVSGGVSQPTTDSSTPRGQMWTHSHRPTRAPGPAEPEPRAPGCHVAILTVLTFSPRPRAPGAVPPAPPDTLEALSGRGKSYL